MVYNPSSYRRKDINIFLSIIFDKREVSQLMKNNIFKCYLDKKN